ncbi:MAG: Fe-S cluster assembly protein NifU [Pseudomonadota bacterium]|jgi:NifU-like protein
MWEYSEKVKEHFFNPRNAGTLENANGIGDVGSISCGDALRLMLKINPETETIEDARFQTFGCGSAIASSSALTEMVKGKTISNALEITNQDIANYLDGLPPEKMHCSVMGREALHAAIANFRGEEWKDDHEEGELICKCFGIDAHLIEETIKANGLTSLEQVTNYTKAGGGCSTCHDGIEEILIKVLAEQGKTLEKPAPKKKKKLTNLQRIKRIEHVIESIRPQMLMDHGDIELIEINEKDIFVKMSGACSDCQMVSATLSGVQQRLIEELGEFVRVLPESQLSKMSGAPI